MNYKKNEQTKKPYLSFWSTLMNALYVRDRNSLVMFWWEQFRTFKTLENLGRVRRLKEKWEKKKKKRSEHGWVAFLCDLEKQPEEVTQTCLWKEFTGYSTPIFLQGKMSCTKLMLQKIWFWKKNNEIIKILSNLRLGIALKHTVSDVQIPIKQDFQQLIKQIFGRLSYARYTWFCLTKQDELQVLLQLSLALHGPVYNELQHQIIFTD